MQDSLPSPLPNDFDTLVCKRSVGDRVSVSEIRGGRGYKVQGLVAGWLKTAAHNTTFYGSIYTSFSSGRTEYKEIFECFSKYLQISIFDCLQLALH